MLQQRAKIQWLKGGDQCTKIFFRKVAMRRAAQRIFQIPDAHGNLLTEASAVEAEFVRFYEELLGGQRRTNHLNIGYLRPWARHIVSLEESEALTCQVTREEVKVALFDIHEDKAPGSDGYSSGFFKAAWPIIGDELTRAVQDFFISGKLLKQVNATLLSLIPKVAAPQGVTDFRPIACCNVVYKIITKVIVDCMQPIMGKVVSPSQNAFVPGRRISSNILLAQELFSGYNRQDQPLGVR
ncbi:UNVERIFIED_CONTAM: hypothetical protein Slati_2212200 [Sesamum latifolium]|uniref:Reverse transcriptase domain-containing protein n=1 Tax=Sesamum latifolium TaxID=2727402 RepID=A0AAW2WTD6_9LAMI